MIRLTTKIPIAKGFSYNMLVRGNHGASVSLLSSMMSYKAVWDDWPFRFVVMLLAGKSGICEMPVRQPCYVFMRF